MANNSVVLITLSSDEDSNTNVASAPSVQKDIKPSKVTARKSIHSKAPLSTTTIRETSLPKVPKPSTSKYTNNAQAKSTHSAEPKEGPSSVKKTARKSLPNSKSQSAPKVVSTMKNSSNPQCASGSSKNETVSTSLKHPLSNSAVVAAAKRPGLTITPLLSSNTVVENVKASLTARKSCNSRPLQEVNKNLNKHFKPSSTSTPKISTEIQNTIKPGTANAKRTFSPLIPVSRDHVKPSAPVAISNSTTKIPASLSIRLAKRLPDVSIHPLSKKEADSKVTSTKSGKSTETPTVNVPDSLLVSLEKTGVTVTSTTKAAVNGKIPETKAATILLKDKKETKTVNIVDAGITKANASSSVSTVNKLTSGSQTSSLIKLLAKDSNKTQGVNEKSRAVGIAVKSGANVTSVQNGQINEQVKVLSTNKATLAESRSKRNIKNAPKTYSELEGSKNKQESSISKKIKRLDIILSSLHTTKSVEKSKDTKSDSNLSLGTNVSKCNTTLNDPIEATKTSNAVTVQPVLLKDYVQSMYRVSTETAPSQVDLSKRSVFPVKEVVTQSSQSQSKKRSLLKDDANDGSVNKKAKLENVPRLNGTHFNRATAEENMKRITAFKESLKKISAQTSKNVAASKKECTKSNSQSKDSGKECQKASESQINNVKKVCPESSNSQSKDSGKECPKSFNSQSKALGKAAKTGKFTDERGSKDSCTISEKLAHTSFNFEPIVSQSKSGNSTKGAMNERPFKQVTSPKLSLKRKAADAARIVSKISLPTIPLPYIQAEPPEKKIKLISSEQNAKPISLPYTPQVLSEKKPVLNSTQLNLNAKAVPLSLNNVAPELSSPAQQKDTSDNSMPWNSSDNNFTRFKKLLEFSKSFMSATPEEKSTIVNNFHKLLEKADDLYVSSAEFSSLLDDTLTKIKVSKDTFIHLKTLKVELKAYKRRKNSTTPAKPMRPSNSSEQSEAFASNLEPPHLPQEVPAPSLGDHLASALHSIASNIKQNESEIGNNDPFPSIPCSSKQADIVENLRLSMPVSNGVKFPSNLIRGSAPPRNIEITEEPCEPILVTNDSPSSSSVIDKAPKSFNFTENLVHLPANGNPPLEADVIVEEAQKRALFTTLDLKSVGPQHSAHKSEAEVVNREHIVGNLPPMPVKKQVDPLKSSDGKRDKIEMRVKLLENHLKKLDKKIKKLQAKELTFEEMDDDDSTYILEDRYKKKFHKVWVTLCKIKKRSPILLGREIDKRFHYEGSRHGAFNKAIEKLINKRKPAEKFPNFNEIHSLLEKINKESHLALDDGEISSEAINAFKDVVRELKRRRMLDDAQDHGCYLTDDIDLQNDPAEQDEELMKTLTKSVEEGQKKFQELFKKYTAKEPKETNDDGSDCEKAASEEEEETAGDEEPALAEGEDATEADEPPAVEAYGEAANSSLEDNPVGIEVTANPHENTDLPDTDPATPDTDAREDEDIIPIQHVARTGLTDVIDIVDSASNASTEPESTATKSTFIPGLDSRIVRIDDMIEIEEEPLPNSDDSLLSVDELIRISKVN